MEYKFSSYMGHKAVMCTYIHTYIHPSDREHNTAFSIVDTQLY